MEGVWFSLSSSPHLLLSYPNLYYTLPLVIPPKIPRSSSRKHKHLKVLLKLWFTILHGCIMTERENIQWWWYYLFKARLYNLSSHYFNPMWFNTFPQQTRPTCLTWICYLSFIIPSSPTVKTLFPLDHPM